MKYILKHIDSSEHIECSKVTINGFDYYVTEETGEVDDFVTNGTQIARINVLTIDDPNKHLCRKIIATNDPKYGFSTFHIPQIIDEGKKYALEVFPHTNEGDVEDCIDASKRNILALGFNKAKETYKWTDEDVKHFVKETLKDAKSSVIWSEEYYDHLAEKLINEKPKDIWYE